VRRLAFALSAAAALVAPASAAADHGLLLAADTAERGYIGLSLHAAPGVEVTLRDESTGATRTLVPDRADTEMRRFARWRCGTRTRRFTATQGELTASAEVVTPSCRRRLALLVHRRVQAGETARLVVRDRWRLAAGGARLCTSAPGEGARCRRLRGRDGSRRELPYEARRPGVHRITVRTEGQRIVRSLRAIPRGGRLRILATGDSMIQIVDSFLAQRVDGRGARVRSDAHISTGISKPSLLDWQAQARRQAARGPDVVVMFIGANDGFPMAGAACCGRAWIREYARRARRMMGTYARGGRARVLWLLLPAPRGGFFREIFPAVNAALRRAAAGREDDVRLVDLAEFFTPGGRYRESMEVGGKVVRVRQRDGVHLNTTGASLAADLVIRTLRADRMLH
jgi:hypothetical protein